MVNGESYSKRQHAISKWRTVQVAGVRVHRVEHLAKDTGGVAVVVQPLDHRVLPPGGVGLLARVHSHAAAVVGAVDLVVVLESTL